MKRPRTSKQAAVHQAKEKMMQGSRSKTRQRAEEAENESGDEVRTGALITNLTPPLEIGSPEDADSAFEEALSGEEAEASPDSGDEGKCGFAALRGIGELADDDDDSDGDLEVMALADLPSQVVKTYRNDEAALDHKLAEIALFDTAKPHGDGKLAFRESLSLVMSLDEALPAELANDDLKREERFAELATESVHIGLSRLRQLGVKFRRPSDYFAEMVKSDTHMAKIKSRILHEKERIEAAQKLRHNRDIKKNKKKLRQAQAEREQGKKQQANQEIKAVRMMNKKRVRDRAAGLKDDNDDDFPIDLLDIEEVKGGAKQFMKAPLKPKANVGRKNNKVGDGAANRLDGNRPSVGQARRNAGGVSGGIRKPGAKLGSKKRPGKARRVKSRAPKRK